MKNVLLLNLMPNKIETENHFKNIFSKLSHSVKISFMRMESYESKNIPKSYLLENYKTLKEISFDDYDRFICTGSPVETLPFEKVDYWEELIEVFDRIKVHNIKSYYICWGAQAVLYYRYGIDKVKLKDKKFGLYEYNFNRNSLHNFYFLSKKIKIPVSRYTESIDAQIVNNSDLSIVLSHKKEGICMLENKSLSEIYNFNHFEYDTLTLKNEYIRDINKKISIDIPKNYFPNDDVGQDPINSWTENAILFFDKWFEKD